MEEENPSFWVWKQGVKWEEPSWAILSVFLLVCMCSTGEKKTEGEREGWREGGKEESNRETQNSKTNERTDRDNTDAC